MAGQGTADTPAGLHRKLTTSSTGPVPGSDSQSEQTPTGQRTVQQHAATTAATSKETTFLNMAGPPVIPHYRQSTSPGAPPPFVGRAADVRAEREQLAGGLPAALDHRSLVTEQ